MGVSAAYGRFDNCVPTMFGPYRVGDPPPGQGPWIGDPPPFSPWVIPNTAPYTPTVTVTGKTAIGGIFPTSKQFQELVDRVERLERQLAETAQPIREPLRAEDV